jgi:hypothetical protein
MTMKHKPPKPPKAHHMTPPVLLSVVNQSQRMTDAEVQRMTLAGAAQLVQHYGPIYGKVPMLEFVHAGQTPTGGSSPITIVDVPDIDGALGYHDEDASGMAFARIFVNPTLDNGGTTLTGPNAVSVTFSHEVLELIGDSPANRWVDGPGGSDFAFEMCDAVEGDAYEIDGVSMSNFVLPAFFDPRADRASNKFDFLGKLSRPFTMTPGGYQIVRTEPGTV